MTSGQSRRASVRKKALFNVTVTRVARGTASVKPASNHDFQGIEISTGGMGLITTYALQKGDFLSLRFTLPGEERTLVLLAKVLNLSAQPEGKPGALRAGLRFENLSQDDHTHISNYLGTTFTIY